VTELFSALGAFLASMLAKVLDRKPDPPPERKPPPVDGFDTVDEDIDRELAEKGKASTEPAPKLPVAQKP
jgi:hypothetical protein